jgi:hypothetical protein
MNMKQHMIATLLLLAAKEIFASDCAILATGAASDLAIDDPDRFEHLTRTCRGESSPRNNAPATSRATTPPTAPSQRPPSRQPPPPRGNRFVSDDDKQRNLQEGCEFLFHSVPDSRHAVGTEACKDGKNLVCKRVGANAFQWAAGGSACVIDPDLLKTQELNLKNTKNIKVFE